MCVYIYVHMCVLCSSNRCEKTLQNKEKVRIPEPNIKSQHATFTFPWLLLRHNFTTHFRVTSITASSTIVYRSIANMQSKMARCWEHARNTITPRQGTAVTTDAHMHIHRHGGKAEQHISTRQFVCRHIFGLCSSCYFSASCQIFVTVRYSNSRIWSRSCPDPHPISKKILLFNLC